MWVGVSACLYVHAGVYVVLCGMTTSHSTRCDCCVCDYNICFRLFALSIPSVPTLRLKDPRSRGWHNSAGYSSDGQVIWGARLSSNSKNRENPFLTNKMFFKHICETINNKETMFAFLAKRRRKNIETGRVTKRCG